MLKSLVRCTAFATLSILIAAPFALCQTAKPDRLQCESLTNPLGADAKRPVFSWKLRDARFGAKQTAYQIEVASSPNSFGAGKAEMWDSGRVQSENSIEVEYAGKELRPSMRYYWRVTVWDKDGKAYPPSDVAWWETGLMDLKNWKAAWIGYEVPELHAVRDADAAWITNAEQSSTRAEGNSHHDFRFAFELDGAAKHAAIYVTGRDAASAWVNGQQMLESDPLPPWKQMPWKTYKVRDISQRLNVGKNVIAIDVIRYRQEPRRGVPDDARSPMSATIYLEQANGAIRVFKSGEGHWKAALDAAGNWQDAAFDDSEWKDAIAYAPPTGSFDGPETGYPWPTGAVKALRKSFDVPKKISSARLYATALGAYKFSINGKSVGDQVMSPGWTDFRERVVYQAYDVTSSLRVGKNAIGALLAPGWYSTPLQWYGQGNNYGKTLPALRAELRIAYVDGSVESVATDTSWKAEVSAIPTAEIYDGETYDARQEQGGWSTVSFNDSTWKSIEVIHPIEPKIEWQYFPPIRKHEELSAKSMSEPKPGVYVFDFGQNLSGVARVRAKGAAGTDVKLRFAEVLNSDGTLYVENLRTAKATDHFILAGEGSEEFEPEFTFHGFRYVEVSGLPAKTDRADVKAIAFYTDAPFTTTLKTGSAMINQLWSNILWGQRSNFVGVPTDCPQRDERLGWSADAQVFWRTAAYNMELGPARNASGNGHVRNFRAGHFAAQSGLWHGLERCRRHRSLDFLDSNRRQESDRRKLERYGTLSCRDRSGESGSSLEKELWDSIRGLAFAGGRDAGGFDRDSLLGLRRETDEANGTCRWKFRGREEIRNIV